MARDPSLDAFMAVGPLNSKITVDAIAATAAARGEPKFLPIDVADAIAKKNPIYESEEIPGSIFSSSPARPEDKVETVSVNHLIIAPKSLSDTAVGRLRPAALHQPPATGEGNCRPPRRSRSPTPTRMPRCRRMRALRPISTATSERSWRNIPTTSGASILLLSGLGSAGAWLKHYWKRDEREQYVAHRDNLLDLISRVRKAETPEELAEMQGAADGMLREALDCYDDGAIEEGDLSVIGLALEQFHHAVADRRAVLGAGGADMPRMRALPELIRSERGLSLDLRRTRSAAVCRPAPQWHASAAPAAGRRNLNETIP